MFSVKVFHNINTKFIDYFFKMFIFSTYLLAVLICLISKEKFSLKSFHEFLFLISKVPKFSSKKLLCQAFNCCKPCYKILEALHFLSGLHYLVGEK